MRRISSRASSIMKQLSCTRFISALHVRAACCQLQLHILTHTNTNTQSRHRHRHRHRRKHRHRHRHTHKHRHRHRHRHRQAPQRHETYIMASKRQEKRKRKTDTETRTYMMASNSGRRTAGLTVLLTPSRTLLMAIISSPTSCCTCFVMASDLYTHANTQTHTHTHTHTHIERTRLCMFPCMHAFAHTPTHAPTHTHTPWRIKINSHRFLSRSRLAFASGPTA